MNKTALDKLEMAVKEKFGIDTVHVVGLESFYRTLTFGQQKEPGFLDSDDIGVYVNGDSALMGVNQLLTDRAVDWFIANRLR